MARYKVVVSDYDYADLGIEREILREIGAELVPSQCRTEEEVLEVARDADAILSQYAPISRRVIESLSKCKVIGRYGIGVDTIDVEAATERGIAVVNVPSYCEDEVSDHTLALILACTRKIVQFTADVKGGKWDWKRGRPIFRLRGQTLGLVAFGKIPKLVAKKARALGLNVIAYDPYVPEEEFARFGVKKVGFDELLQEADIISVHTPLTEETRHMFSTREFRAMKRSAYIINTSRGPVIDEKALCDALTSGEIAGAGLDVLEEEPPKGDNPLLRLDNVVLTPHVAWYSEDSQEELRTKLAQDIARVLTGKIPEGFVNPEVGEGLKLEE